MLALCTEDGSYCLTCGRDRHVVLWNPRTGLRMATYQGHGLAVNDAVRCVRRS